ncbi:MAG TPA: dephospho-CoA kinase [Alphaproteobacteria bacterium]|jgi:dephospho-CoA kinase
MIVVGLTGSIGMGKSNAARSLRYLGVPVYDADAEVHKLYAKGGAAVAPIARVFPFAVRNGAVDRAKLSELLRADPGAVARLEKIVHPLVRGIQERFLRAAAVRREKVAVLDIPLLFETGGEKRCDAVIVVSAPAYLQRQRVLRRPGMSDAKLDLLLGRQMPDTEKRRRADFVIHTNRGYRETLLALRKILRTLKMRGGRSGVHRRRGAVEKFVMARRRRPE